MANGRSAPFGRAEKAQKAQEIDTQLREISSVILSRDLQVRNLRMESLKAELAGIGDAIRLAGITRRREAVRAVQPRLDEVPG